MKIAVFTARNVFALLLPAALLLMGCGAGGDSSATEVHSMLQAGARVIDVRTPGEFKSGHYPGAVNIPLREIKDRLSEIGSKEKPVVLYCAAGGRSAAATRILQLSGYEKAVNAGGLRDMLRLKSKTE